MRLTPQKANLILSSSVCLQQGLEVLVILDHRSCVTCIVMTPMWVMLQCFAITVVGTGGFTAFRNRFRCGFPA